MNKAKSAQQQQMAQSRQNTPPSNESGKGESPSVPGEMIGIKEKLVKTDEWGKLPKRMARDIQNSRKEQVAEQYQEMVNAYFKVIAEQAQGDKK